MGRIQLPDALDHSLTIVVVVWFALSTTALIIFLRLTARLYFRQTSRQLDDILVLVSFVFFLGQAVSIDISARHGMGLDSSRRQAGNILSIEKAQYAASLLAISSLCFSRLAYLGFIRALVPGRRDRLLVAGSSLAVVLWAIVSFPTTAFQCQADSPWNYVEGKCFDRVTWAIACNAIDASVDALLVLIPIYILSGLSLGVGKKISIMCYFCTRLLVIAASICAAIFWTRLASSSDQIRDVWVAELCVQIILAFSIISSIILYLKPFLSSIEAGFYANEDIRRRGSDYASGKNTSYKLSTISRKWKSRVNVAKNDTKDLRRDNGTITTSDSDKVALNQPEGERNPADNIIATTTWTVRSEETQLA